MFKKTDPQRKLFGVDTNLASGMRARLKASWAEVFRREILPILMRSEEEFAFLYGPVGRPNFSVGRMLGLCFLQEMHGYADQEALDAFGFDTRWQYALDLEADEEAYLSRRSLVGFRGRLVSQDPEMTLMREIFEQISEAAIGKIGLSVKEQRTDSTHIASNIHTHGRIDLFQSTLQVFLRSLDKERYAALPEDIRAWFEEESNGWFGLGSDQQKRDKLARLAKLVYRLIELFEEDKEVVSSEAYQILSRLFEEQCEVEEKKDSDDPDTSTDEPVVVEDLTKTEESEDAKSQDDESDRNDEPEIQIKKKPSGGDTLQSPHDPDASYGHKGVGYSVHITETCNNEEGPEIITDYEVHGAARSDRGKALDTVERLEDTPRKPDVLYADGGYPTVPSVPEIEAHGVELVAPVDRGKLGKDVMGRDRFEFDEQGNVNQCPAGKKTVGHRILSNGTDKTLHAVFDGDTCRSCPMLDKCPVRAPNHRNKGASPRETKGDFRLEITLALRRRDEMYKAQQTPEWKERYKIRSGVEATMSEGKRKGLGKLRVRRLPCVHFAVVCKIIACNILRLARSAAYSGLMPYTKGVATTRHAAIWTRSLRRLNLFANVTHILHICLRWRFGTNM